MRGQYPVKCQATASLSAAGRLPHAEPGDDPAIFPTRALVSLRDIDAEKLSRVLAINAVGPALVAKHFLPRLRKETKTVFAALSARVGSIGDNRLGGWYSYRASKAALNMLLKTLSIEQARLLPQSIVVGLHPGTVDTGLSRPYSKGTSPQKIFSPETAAGHLVAVLDKVCQPDSGGVFAWDSKRIEN